MVWAQRHGGTFRKSKVQFNHNCESLQWIKHLVVFALLLYLEPVRTVLYQYNIVLSTIYVLTHLSTNKIPLLIDLYLIVPYLFVRQDFFYLIFFFSSYLSSICLVGDSADVTIYCKVRTVFFLLVT